jgi:hypothetical protein
VIYPSSPIWVTLYLHIYWACNEHGGDSDKKDGNA